MENQEELKPVIDLSNIKFISDDHIRYQDGVKVPGNNKDCWRGIRVQNNIEGGEGYTVTVYNMDGNNPVWNNNIQMATKQMKIEEQSNIAIQLRGFGSDNFGNSFADYGIILHLLNAEVNKVTLKMYDRKVDIVYYKHVHNIGGSFSQTLESACNTLVQQHFNNLLATNKNISISDLELDIANLIAYIKAYKENSDIFNLAFLDNGCLNYLRGHKDDFSLAIITETCKIYSQHYDYDNGIASMTLEFQNSNIYGNGIVNYLREYYTNEHLYAEL